MRLLTADEVAQLLRVRTPRVHELARTGQLQGVVVRIGRQVRFREDALVAYIEAGGHELAGGWRRDSDDETQRSAHQA